MIILAVDDDEDDLEFFEEVIASIDPTIRCVFAKNCQQAYEILRNTIPDALFLDINMPRINGLECFKYLKETDNLKKIPVVFYSTAVNPLNIKYLLSPIVRSITKEATFAEAKTSIANVLKDLNLLPVSLQF